MVRLNLSNRRDLGSLGEMDSLSWTVKTFIRNPQGFELREIQLRLIFCFLINFFRSGWQVFLINDWLSLTFTVMITSVFTETR